MFKKLNIASVLTVRNKKWKCNVSPHPKPRVDIPLSLCEQGKERKRRIEERDISPVLEVEKSGFYRNGVAPTQGQRRPNCQVLGRSGNHHCPRTR